MIFTFCRKLNDLSVHCFNKSRVFSFRVNNHNICIRRKKKIYHFFLCGKGFARTGYTENKAITVEQKLSVYNNHIFRYNIYALKYASVMLDFLNFKRHKNSKALCCKSTPCFNSIYSYRKCSIKSLELLIF